MKLALILIFSVCALAQTPTITRAAVITITDANNPPETAYSIYRGLCRGDS